jgi:ABC-type nitrate/sulfonate/bicarbonate transport system permease component
MSGQGELRIDAVSRTFHGGGEKLLALDRVSLTVTPGALLTIVGASGCGKSTLLRLIAGPAPVARPRRTAMIHAWTASIGSAYFMTIGPGIGSLIIAGPERFQMDLVMLAILIPGLVGFLINRGASAIEARLLRWRVA